MARSRLGSFKMLKDGRVRVTVSHGYRADGKQRRVSAVAASMEEAEREAVRLATELGRRPDLARGLTLAQWWEAYRVGKGTRIARSTLDRYAGDMRRVWLPAIGERDISLVECREVQGVLSSLPTRAYATHAVRSLSAVLTQAVREGHLGANPIRGAAFELPEDAGRDDADYDRDPFAAIEGASDVWDARTVLRVMPMLRGDSLETCWLAMVGAGLRRQEALALRWRDVRRIEVSGREVTQVAVHHALTAQDGRKRTKTPRSVRIVALVEPFGARLWELRGMPDGPVCGVSVSNIQHRWHALWEPVTSRHARRKDRRKGLMVDGVDPPVPYLPLGRMRATHETYMQQAGVLDSVNAATHGHSERVSYRHYQRPDGVDAAIRAGDFLLLEGGAAQGGFMQKGAS